MEKIDFVVPWVDSNDPEWIALYSFLNEDTQPYIYDMKTGVTIHLSRRGEDPHGIMIPYDFKYPKEKICIKDAYEKFNNWGENRVTSTDWYVYPTEDLVF